MLYCTGTVDEVAFKDAMARVPAPVAVIAARVPEGFRGLTATSFTSVSAEPPLVLVCIDNWSATRDAVTSGGAFAASVLARRQEFLADRFSGRAPQVDPSWREVPHRLGASGLPILEGCVAWFECEVEEFHAAGDHTIVLGRVTAAGYAAGEPLVFWDRAFWRVG